MKSHRISRCSLFPLVCLFPCGGLTVQGRDSGLHSLSGTATVLCSVLDENDNEPEFTQPSVHISIPENLPPGVVHTAQASDPDSGLNGSITYSLHHGGWLTIAFGRLILTHFMLISYFPLFLTLHIFIISV